MALPVIVAQESIADELVSLLVKFAKEQKSARRRQDLATGAAGVGGSPRIRHEMDRERHRGRRKLVLDGRGAVEGFKNGFYLGPPYLTTSRPICRWAAKIFGPVICIKRVKSFKEGVELMNANRFANGSVIFTQNGHYAREFARLTHGGMVGVNVGIPVPVGIFPFSGHKDSFFGDLHTLGKDGVRFYTETRHHPLVR